MDKKKLITGYIVAAAYARKIRRSAFALFKDDADEDEIMRATSELNRKIFELMVSMGIAKQDVVRIIVEGAVKDGKLVFGEPQIELFVPKQKLDECVKRLEKIKTHLHDQLDVETR